MHKIFSRHWFIGVFVFLLTLFFLTECEFRSHSLRYKPQPSVTYKLRLNATLTAQSTASSAHETYTSESKVLFSVTTHFDSSKSQFEMLLAIDSILLQSSERPQSESQYMAEKLGKYKAKIIFNHLGELLLVEEDPALPSIQFSLTNFGKMFLQAMPAFPANAIKVGSQWEWHQNMLDKFHPQLEIVKHFHFNSIHQTPAGKNSEFTETFSTASTPENDSSQNSVTTAVVQFNMDQGKWESADLTTLTVLPKASLSLNEHLVFQFEK